MKRLIFVLLCTISICSYGQFEFGLQGGLNFSENLDLSLTAIPDDFNDVSEQKTGWHAGFFGQINFAVFRLRSELQYSQTQTSINRENFTVKTIDLPLTLGYKIIPPLSVFAGPVFQYQMLEDSFENFRLQDFENSFGTGIHLGIRAYFKKIGLDFRYERPFNSTEIDLLDPRDQTSFGRFNSRENQWILGISVQLN